jgi:hypothetical protein
VRRGSARPRDRVRADPWAGRRPFIGLAVQRRRATRLEDQGCRGVVRDLPDDVPRILVGEHADAVGRRFSARFGARVHALFALDAEADQGADLAAELDRLVLGEVAEMRDLDLSGGVLVDGERVDDAHRLALLQAL